MERIDAESIRDVLRKRLKRDEIDSQHHRYDNMASYGSDKSDRRNDRSSRKRKTYNYKNRKSRQLQVVYLNVFSKYNIMKWNCLLVL